MKPTIGQIVIYNLAVHELEASQGHDHAYRNNGATECPAVVVRVFNDGKINLKLMTDGPHTPWRTSVVEGSEPGTWHWPPRA